MQSPSTLSQAGRANRPGEPCLSGKTALLEALRARGFAVEEETFMVGRPDRLTLGLRTRAGAALIAKVYPDDSGQRTFANMERLWNSSFGARRQPPGMAQPLEYLPELRVSLVERLEGKPMAEMVGRTVPGEPRFGRDGSPYLQAAIRLLADLHECGVQPEVRRSWRGIMRSLARKVQRIGELAPQHLPAVEKVMELLANRRIKDSELVCAHGDFSPRNVLIGKDRLALIDWERLQQADPARDLAYFATWGWRERVQRGRMPDRALLRELTSAYQACRPGSRLAKQLPFHIAAGLVRMCCTVAQLWPAELYLVPALAQMARRELEDAP
jgi:Ser/Thr protein kinase RdoA (MazF antagonist)